MANVRKPTSIHLANGTFRKDRHGEIDNQLIIEQELPPPPQWIDELARTEWFRIVDAMGLSVLRATDSAALTLYCTIYSTFVQSKGLIPPPLIVQFRSVMNDLGLTPQSRAKINLPSKKKKGNEFSNL
jgi:phage terminase small subunit